MGTGWRRAFCTTIPRDREAIAEEKQNPKNQTQISQNASPEPVRNCVKLGIFSSISNPSTPRCHSQPAPSPSLRCRTRDGAEAQSASNTSRLHCKTVEKKSKSPRIKLSSNPFSPRSPFSIFKSTFRLYKNVCGVCFQSVKTGQGMAIYTAECSHSFHFPCIAQRVRKQGSMVCPVCSCTWKDLLLLSSHKKTLPLQDQNDEVEKIIAATTTSTCADGTLLDDNRIQSSITSIKTKHDQSRPYNDDEPLLSPTAGGRFNPIPEEDEDNEDVGEFQGFFVNPTPSTPTKKPSPKFVHGRQIQQDVEVKLLPEVAVVSVGRSGENFAVALRVKAPPPLPSPSHRASVDLVTIVDVSGSMPGSKLHMLKRAMRLVISSLGSSDRLSIVAFSSSPQRLLPLRRMTHQGQRLARRIVDRLAAGNGKSVNSALKLAAKVLEDRREKNPVASIVLLSDGQEVSPQGVNEGQRQQNSHVSSARFGHIEIPVHSLGYNPESVLDALARRVGVVLSVVVQDLTLQLGLSSGKIKAVYSCNGLPRLLSSSSVRLGDLYAEEERELLVELQVPTPVLGAHHVMSVRCSFRDPPTGEVVYARERALLVPRPVAGRSSERLRAVFLAVRAVAETPRLVERGELGGAERLLVSARMAVAQSSSAPAEEYVRLLEAELAVLKRRRREQEAAAEKRRMGDLHVAYVDENGEPLTPTSAWRAAEQLAKVALMKKSLNRANDLHGFENARF